MSIVQHPAERLAEEGKELIDFCKTCTKNRLARTDGAINKETGKPLYMKGDFIIDCKGIPAEDKFIPYEDKIVQRIESQSKSKISPEMLDDMRTQYDPIRWAEKHLDWFPRASRQGEMYQSNILRCSSKRKVLRCGRRLGKSETLIVGTLHKLFTHSPKTKRYDTHTQRWVEGESTIMFVAPYLSQVKDFFSRLRKFIDKNPALKAEVKNDVSTPFFRLELKSGMILLGFSAGSSGASSLRGQKADFIVLDEMDYLRREDLDTIMALIMEHNDVELMAASTPSGRRENFYEWCMDRMDFKQFHYRSSANPSWGPKMEAELRASYATEIGWQHEIEAEFGEAATSVFQYEYLEQAMTRYHYENERPKPEHIYSIGVDWNDTHNGTKIRVLEYNPATNRFRAVDHATVQKAGWTQTAAVEQVIKMNRKWNCQYIYVDAGYGATQIEMLRKVGQNAQFRKDQWAMVDMNLINTVGINSSSTVEIFDPISGLPKKEKMKPFIIETAVRKFEMGLMEFPYEDESLLKQLHGYSIAKVSASGQPVYEAGPEGDHDLDAFVLSILAFELEMSEYTNRTYSSSISFSGRIGEGTFQQIEENQPAVADQAREIVGSSGPRKPQLRSEIISNSKIGAMGKAMQPRVYSAEAFNHDAGDRPHGHAGSGIGFTPVGQYRGNPMPNAANAIRRNKMKVPSRRVL